MQDRIYIFDTTLRDGEQSPGATMNTNEKLRVAHQLAKAGVDIIEAGFPIASSGDFEAVSKIAKEVRGVCVAGLARCMEKDIDEAWRALEGAEEPRLHVFLSTSPIHMEHQLRLPPEKVLEMISSGVARAKGYTSNVEFSPMDATRSDIDFLVQAVSNAVQAGATTVNIADTVGYALPDEFAGLISLLLDRVPGLDQTILSVHCHNDLGLATANTLAAIKAGARQVESTVNGIGERAGNCAMEEIVMAVATRRDLLDLKTGVDTTQLYPLSRLVSMITGIHVQPNKAIIGANAFAHESGIHQDGVLKDSSTYEIMRPETVGLTSSQLVLGKHSGRHALKDKVVALGYDFNESEIDRLFSRFKALADKKKDVFNEDLEALIVEEFLTGDDIYEFRYLNVMCGTQVHPVATVGLTIRGEEVKSAGFGAGPVDAVYQTITQMAGSRAELLRFAISAITGGTDAQGEVTVRLKDGDLVTMGRAADPDILVASAKALVNGLNRMEQLHQKPLKNGFKA